MGISEIVADLFIPGFVAVDEARWFYNAAFDGTPSGDTPGFADTFAKAEQDAADFAQNALNLAGDANQTAQQSLTALEFVAVAVTVVGIGFLVFEIHKGI